jgi:hypothetical protein
MENNIFTDYAKLRKAIGAVQKSGENPHFKNTYVELNTAIQVIDDKLEAHNFICFIQTPINIEGKNYLHTELLHTSGEKITSDLYDKIIMLENYKSRVLGIVVGVSTVLSIGISIF